MKLLCPDKTGILTTAKMTVYYNNAKVYNGFTAEQGLDFASLASSEAHKDDPIDSAVLRAYTESKSATTTASTLS